MVLNPFTGDGYNMASMTAAVNKLPNLYNRLVSVFTPSGIATTTLLMEQIDGTLNIIRARERGAPADKNIMDKRVMRAFAIPHIPIEDVLLPDDYQNIRAFGEESGLETQAGILARKLQSMKNKIDQTREFLRMGALKGIILNADGSTLYNLYTEFSISAKVISFALADEATDVRAKILELKRHVELNLRGESMTGIRVLVDGTFFDALTSHPSVVAAFDRYQANGQNLADDYRSMFKFAGVTFEEYPATWTDKDGTARLAIASGTGHAFPEGTGNVFEEVFAPGNFLETANTIGLPYYARQEARRFNAGLDIWAESNPLPICKRPEVLVRVTVA